MLTAINYARRNNKLVLFPSIQAYDQNKVCRQTYVIRPTSLAGKKINKLSSKSVLLQVQQP